MDALARDLRFALPHSNSSPDLAHLARITTRLELSGSASLGDDHFPFLYVAAKRPVLTHSPLNSPRNSPRNSRLAIWNTAGNLSPRPVRAASPGIVSSITAFKKLHGSDFSRAGSYSHGRGREERRQRKAAVETQHIDSPAIWMNGEEIISEGPIPSCISARALEEALLEMPKGSRFAVVKCITAWRIGHLETSSIVDMLRSMAWQSPVLKYAMSTPTTSDDSGGSSKAGEDDCELLSEEDIAALLGDAAGLGE